MDSVSTMASKALARMKNQKKKRIVLRLNGTTPLVLVRFNLARMLGCRIPMPGRRVKFPGDGFVNSIYRNVNGTAVVPTRMVKAAIVKASKFTDPGWLGKWKMGFRVLGETSPIKGFFTMERMVVR